MTRDFYDTLAQVFPVLLLALVWDSAYLDRLRGQRRPRRSIDPSGVRFWTKPRVRAYTLTVVVVVIASMTIITLVLADFIPDSFALRIILSCGLILVLATLLWRIYYDVLIATAATKSQDE